MKLASFATSMRAHSLAEALRAVNIACNVDQPKWTNKRLPPPKVEVHVTEADSAKAQAVLVEFNTK